ncbi:MAG: carboxylating nicotinate-nucleotide diphosphorylase [Fimbriiglobus sp.]
MFTTAETNNATRLIELALAEDLADVGDITCQVTIPPSRQGRAVFVARTPGAIAGLPIIALVCAKLSPAIEIHLLTQDGTTATRGMRLATVSGPLAAILSAERTALNFLQRLSGVASLTAKYVEAVRGIPVQVLDTRKTTPGWRLLEKYAVRMGGGTNHRIGLYDGILIKDNHLAGFGEPENAVKLALEATHASPLSKGLPIEIEVDTLDQLDQSLVGRPAIVLLDNMSNEQLREAVRRRNERAPHVRLEASGGVNLTTIRGIAETGVDRISVGAITHSAPALDIALDYDA